MEITRRFELDAGHRLLQHGGKCSSLHGHRYAFLVTVAADVDVHSGMVEDFSCMKATLGKWLDDNLDHGVVLQDGDPLVELLKDPAVLPPTKMFVVPKPPTAENLAELVGRKAAELLVARVVAVTCSETPNCSATWRAEP